MSGGSPVARGLDGLAVGRSKISWVDGELGSLVYRGFDVRELVPGTPYESVAHLLLYGDPPPEDPSRQVRDALSARRQLSPGVVRVVDALPANEPPLDALRTLISAIGTGQYDYPPKI